MLTTTCTILALICITAIINQAHPHPRNNKALTDRQTIGATCQQVKPRSRTNNSPKGHVKAQQSFNVSYSLFCESTQQRQNIGQQTLALYVDDTQLPLETHRFEQAVEDTPASPQ